MDAPYRIESYRNYEYRMVYAIKHSGVGVVAEVFSLDYARKVVDALNKDVRDAQGKITRPSRDPASRAAADIPGSE